MSKPLYVIAISISLAFALGAGSAFAQPPPVMDAEALVKLAPRISLEEERISTFEVKGTLDLGKGGIKLRFSVAGKQPDQFAITIMDPRDHTPVMVGVGDSFALYDPVLSEVVLGRAISSFVLRVDEDAGEKAGEKEGDEADADDRNLMLGFQFKSVSDKPRDDGKESETQATVIDLLSFLAVLRTPLDVQAQGDGHYVLSGQTRKGGRATAYVTPSRPEGPYSRIELSLADEDEPFLILDEIVLNQPLAEGRFAFPKEALLASGLSTREFVAGDGPISTVLSVGALMRALLTRMVLAGLDEPEIRQAVEKMSGRTLDWETLKKSDKEVGARLRDVFGRGDEDE